MLGRRYNAGKLKWSLLDWTSLRSMVKVLMYGAHKYSVFKDGSGNIVTGAEISPEAAEKLELQSSGQHNWKTGLKTTEICDSTMRHLVAYMQGEDIDPESGLPHTGHLFCNIMFLEYMMENRPELDDRVIDKETEK